ncbi:MAG: DNA polymerase III subunit alpha [Parcubacteria bacterium C7867-005]|nr:MAG: DNA polymerase III subunit alpha [Parcubacteria bacterium C7867-005]
MSKLTHLHTHSHYSLLEALPKIPDLVKTAKKMGMESLALTDSGNLYGAIEFYKECRDAGIKPIIGLDAYVAVRGLKDKEARIDNQRSRLVLLAKDETGYRNLIKLVTISNFEGFYYKPRIDKELLEKYADGLVVIMPSFSGEVIKTLTPGDEDRAKRTIEWYKKIFGEDNFFLEITHHKEIGGHEEKMVRLLKFAEETKTKIVAAHDVYYLDPEDKPARDTMLSIQSHVGKDTVRSMNDEEENFSFLSTKEMAKLFKDTPEALENIEVIVSKCNLELKLGSWVFPKYIVESGKTYDDELRELVYKGFEYRNVKKTKEVLDRVEYELKVIKDKGYSPYFLVVGDLLHYAHDHGILTNIRGSVAGSMVTYLARITNVNPIEYKLPFERFLNPDRPSAPDIDMDFADNRRDEIIEYARTKYGRDNVAQIGTFGTMMARGAVRDVARAMNFAYGVGDQIAKLIPVGAQGFPMTLDRAMKENADLKKLYNSDPDTKTIIDMAKKIEGCARHISVHAAGVVISPGPLTDYTPLQFDTKGENKIITQYDMYSIEEAGLLKFDFLGIKNLSIIADAIDRIKKIEGTVVDIENIPLDDKKTFAMLSRGETEGTFQLNGDGMTQFLVKLKPSSIHDINAMVALYRPGPIETIPSYIERKHNPELIKYLDPRMKEFLDFSYGVIVYQDDVLLTAIRLAGYNWVEADKLRKAMGKKIPEVMQAEKEKLTKGFIEFGKLTPELSEKIWKLIEPFAAYGFNKAHAASYGRMAYQTSYLKANFPAIYMSAVLTADSGDVERIGVMIAECKRMGIEVLPPSVNESYSQFTVVNDPPHPYKIRFGLTTIKNFGQGISTSIIEERKRGGKFKTLVDFLDRIKDKNLNKKSLEALIRSGAMDEFGDRGILGGNIENLLAYNKERARESGEQESLFGLMSDTSTLPTLKLIEAKEATKKEKLLWEKDLLGLYISGHPLEEFKDKMEKGDNTIKKLIEMKEGADCVVAGIVIGIREVTTKKGDRMVFVELEDFTGTLDVVVFPKIFEEFKSFLVLENCIAIKGKVSKRNDETSMIADKIKAL